MRRLRMLEEQEAWKREAGFDRIEIIAEMHAQRLHAVLIWNLSILYHTFLDDPIAGVHA